ncbi:hypothetical protein FLAG1_00285 [Fusarium langsethiae]|uniref:Nadh-ubiquinone reductase complex 1 mlrq subunit n=1 Tax=Fusarium langsethiae TaxID=179993 RepID=A0A0M9F5U4_FUSLA|nr:hypothetical protein FLAG1_00285 [Fusarium langsethiae]GKU00447.1 unnamed protein product [Fusarium langsethiae]GKU12929.1 unnamed protein product [Fusarium langsethiae]
MLPSSFIETIETSNKDAHMSQLSWTLTESQGHTISQRLRKLKQIPPELYPLAVVVGFALGAAGYSVSRKFIVDKNLRLARQGPAARQANNDHGSEEH